MGSYRKIIIIADDFGMSPGINKAIQNAVLENLIDGAGIIANGHCANEAINFALKQKEEILWGLHFNCEYGKALNIQSEPNTLVNKSGFLYHSFSGIFIRYYIFKDKSLATSIEAELNAQIDKLENAGITLSYIDSHRHIHAIPFIYRIVDKVSRERDIKRIRRYKESWWKSFVQTGSLNCLNPINIIKWLLLTLLGRINRPTHKVYLFSVLLSCVLKPSFVKRLKFNNRFDLIEIMVHPGIPKLDSEFYTDSALVNDYIRSKHRTLEYQFIQVLKEKLLIKNNSTSDGQ